MQSKVCCREWQAELLELLGDMYCEYHPAEGVVDNLKNRNLKLCTTLPFSDSDSLLRRLVYVSFQLCTGLLCFQGQTTAKSALCLTLTGWCLHSQETRQIQQVRGLFPPPPLSLHRFMSSMWRATSQYDMEEATDTNAYVFKGRPQRRQHYDVFTTKKRVKSCRFEVCFPPLPRSPHTRS